MNDEKKLKGPYEVLVTNPDGEVLSEIFIDSTSATIAAGSTVNIGIPVTKEQYNEIERRLNMLESFAEKQEKKRQKDSNRLFRNWN